MKKVFTYDSGFQPVGHGPVVGHSSVFSGPQSINQNESNDQKIGNKIKARTFFFMFLGPKLRNGRQFQNEGLFFEITRFLRRKLNFVDPSGSLSYLGLKRGPRYEKV